MLRGQAYKSGSDYLGGGHRTGSETALGTVRGVSVQHADLRTGTISGSAELSPAEHFTVETFIG